MHTQGERHTPTTKHLRSWGDVPNLTRTHEEAREQAGKELHWTHSRYTSLDSAQAKHYMGTSNGCKPVYHKLLLDHAGEWYRAAKSIQEDQTYVKDQIYSNRSRTDRVQEQPVDRTRESWVSHPAIPNTVRDCVQENSLENVSPDPVQWTLPRLDTYPQTSSFDSKSEDRGEITEPLWTDGPVPALEIPEEQERGTYTPGSQKSTRKNFGKPASSFSDFYM